MNLVEADTTWKDSASSALHLFGGEMVHHLSVCEHRGKYMKGLRFLCHFPKLIIGSACTPLRPGISSLGSDFYGASACLPALSRTRFGPGNQLEEGLCMLPGECYTSAGLNCSMRAPTLRLFRVIRNEASLWSIGKGMAYRCRRE